MHHPQTKRITTPKSTPIMKPTFEFEFVLGGVPSTPTFEFELLLGCIVGGVCGV